MNHTLPAPIKLTKEALAQVLELELFQGLNKKKVELLADFAELLRVPIDHEFVQQGEFSSKFYVVLGGIVSAYRTEEDGKTRLLDQLAAGSWFGEVSALSNQPSLAKLKADLPCSLLVLEGALFKELYGKSPRSKTIAEKGFRKLINDQYRSKSLSIHLAVVPSLRQLGHAQLNRLKQCARFETFEAGTVIAEAGQPVEALYLVRSGAVTLHNIDEKGVGQLDGYLRDNSSFGETALLREPTVWQGEYRAMERTEMLVLPGAEVIQAFANETDVLDELTNAAMRVALEDQGLDPDGGIGQLEIMIHRKSTRGGEALVINLEKCVRCNACVESCVAVHEDRIPRISKKGNRIEADANTLGSPISLITACYNCQTPGCMMACDYGAIRRDPQGLIRFIWENCVGCAACMEGCPYDVIRLTSPPEEQVEGEFNLLERMPIIGGFFKKTKPFRLGQDQERGFHKDKKKVDGKAVKCDRCEGLPFEACVYNCPCGAIERRSPHDLFSGIVEMARSAK